MLQSTSKKKLFELGFMINIERAIQKAIIFWVKKEFPDIIITGTDNENNYKDTASIGCIGISDLLLFDPRGKVLFLELKKKKGKLLASQIEFNNFFDINFSSCSIYTRAVAYGFDEAKEIILAWVSLSDAPPSPLPPPPPT